MAREWQVVTERLEETATKIEDETQKFDKEWSKLYAEVEVLRSDRYKGHASDSFNKKLNDYRSEFEEISAVLKRYAALLKSTAEAYRKTESKVQEATERLP